jgi:hypothetical protein
MDFELPMDEINITNLGDVKERITSLKKKIIEAHSAKKKVYVGSAIEENGRNRQSDHYKKDGMRGVMYYTKIEQDYKYKDKQGESLTGIKAAEEELIDCRNELFPDKQMASGQSMDLKGIVYIIV